MSKLELKHHADGTPYVRLWWRNTVTGKVERPYRRFPGMTDAQALDAAREWAGRYAQAASLGASLRVGDVMARYIDAMEARGAAANTVAAYRSDLRNYVEPYIGRASVDEVRPYVVDTLYDELIEGGARDGGPLSPATVRRVHWFLSGAFEWAVSQELCAETPMPFAHPPSPDAAEPTALLEEDLEALTVELTRAMERPASSSQEVAARSAAFAAWIALVTGARCGEACAIRWREAPLARGMVRITGTVVETPGGVVRQDHTKGRRPRNVSVTPENVAVMRSQREWQASILPPGARQQGVPLCCSAGGGYLRPSWVSAWFGRLAKGLGLPDDVTFHTLRHTHATVLLAQGVDLRTVQERLGHAKAATTLELYAHVVPGRDAAAAAAFGRALGR